MKYRRHKAEETFQIQEETLFGDVETIESDLEQDSTCCFNYDTSNVDWVESQADSSCDDFEILDIDWRPDYSHCSDDITSDGDWG